ncbi:hypothetical protein [Oceaniglobus trochenteri]|uniref:hypothetical protein n=1 Tax=Oceaniglobus trochenteri TaxID=2763260 RepID=UPI001CFF9B5E|nr:hypothetical protein [Oceaniglobus trochenteri]
MTARAALWGGGVVASVVLHGGLVLMLAAAVAPDPPPPAGARAAAFDISSYQVPQTKAPEAAPDAPALSEGATGGRRATGRAVPQSRAAPLPMTAERAAPISPPEAIAPRPVAGERLPGAAGVAGGERLPPVTERAAAVAARAASGQAVPSTPATEARLAEAPVRAEAAAPGRVVANPVAPIAVSAARADRAVAPGAPLLAASPIPGATVQPARAQGAALSGRAPSGGRLVAGIAPAPRLTGLSPEPAPPLTGTALPARPAAEQDAPVASLRAEPVKGALAPLGAVAPKPAATLGALSADPVQLAGLAVSAPRGQAAPLPATQTRPTRPAEARVQPAAVTPTTQSAKAPDAPALGDVSARGEALTGGPGAAEPLGLTVPEAPRAAPVAPQSARQTAALAWSGAGAAALDDLSLAAIQAFSRADDPSGDGPRVRDAIGAMLAKVPCARLQTVFDPETGQLELRGHIPEEGLRAPVLAALSARVGGAIPLVDTVQVLPRPQCGTLAGIEAVGLAQSDDQLGDPRVLGEQPFTRIARFVEGQFLGFPIEVPDYPAFLYADFYDAAGRVLHLRPAEIALHDRIAPGESIMIDRAPDGRPITVTAPFGKEILVAFAASSPLPLAERPVYEPAAPYLDALADAVAQARAADAAFRGEWFYVLVETRAGP